MARVAGAGWQALLIVLDVCPELARDVLQQCATPVNVQRLHAVADGEHWFVGGEGVVEQGEVGPLALRVWVSALRVPRAPYRLGSTSEGLPGSTIASSVLSRLS